MEIIRKEHKLCICCMEEHDVLHVKVIDKNIFKGQEVEYKAVYEYCDNADEYWANDEYTSKNDIAMKDAYRKKLGLLTSYEIAETRKKYGMSQSDLAILLDWGKKTITRYEGHQVQDAAHDAILKKIGSDPEWLLSLLEEKRDSFSADVYGKYKQAIVEAFRLNQDSYLRKAIYANYAKIDGNVSYCGGINLNLDKVVEVIQYLSNSTRVKNLYIVKLMKMLWYVDALSFKRYGHTVTGLAYSAMPLGAVPLSYKSIINLDGINYEEVDFGDNTGYKFMGVTGASYKHLSADDKHVIDDIIAIFGFSTKDDIVGRMHKETAYIKTQACDLIMFEYARDLSIE